MTTDENNISLKAVRLFGGKKFKENMGHDH
jgi:hypothetical protein